MTVLSSLARFAFGLSFLVCSVSVSAQTAPKPIEAATKFDEYGRIGGCDHSARLDNMAIEVQNNPNLEAYLVYYGPESASELTLDILKDYLINSRGISDHRLKTIYAGPNSDPTEPRIQLWVAPQGAPLPELTSYESKVETFNGLFTERERWESIYFGEGEGTGPPIPDVSLPTFIDMLKRRQDTRAYIVSFSGTEAAPGAWRRVAELESESLKSKGVTADRIKIIYGGSDKEIEGTKIQFWILPENEPPPVVDDGPELPPSSTRQIGSFGEYELGDERGERWAFKVLLDGLRTSEELRVCIIVRLESKVDEELDEPTEETPLATPLVTYAATEGEAMPEESPEPQRADFFKLVDKWKSEFAEKHKIRHDRIIVLFTTPRESEGNTLETWLVPPGARLPDPDADPNEAKTDDKPMEAEKAVTKVKPQNNNPPP